MAEGGVRELEHDRRWILFGPHVLPVQDELAELRIPAGGLGTQIGVREPIGSGVSVGEERRSVVLGMPRPPADLYLLGIARVAHDEVVARGIGRLSGEERDREVEG